MTEAAQRKSAVRLPAGARLLASGLGFTEGPAVVDAASVVITSVNRGHIYRVPLDGSAAEFIVETGGGPNGAAVSANGEIWIAQNGGTAMKSRSVLAAGPSLQRWADGMLEMVLDEGLDAPSDCVFGPDGALWFTDPASHDLDGGDPGRLLSFDPVTQRLQVQRLGLQFPNGLAFGESGDELYVAETAVGAVRRYRLTATGCEPDGWEIRLPAGKPDGMAIDSEGWLWIAGSVGDNVVAVDQMGRIREEVDFGDGVLVTSVCFADPDLKTLVVTVAKGGTVLAMPALHPGLPVPARR
jgi:gluconolactonase